jgi:tRNA1Val (adenine37-N6)-methyltransferase
MVNQHRWRMGNSYFRFKQFKIHQENTAMKVSTDACIFGAWLASLPMSPAKILDIGTGTGLLTAMLAQVWQGNFTAVEIDPSAAKEASWNLQQSPWAERILMLEGDIRSMHIPDQFDFICSNPPFYDKDLKSPEDRINLARHSSALQLGELLDKSCALLKKPGMLALLMPYHRAEETIEKAFDHGLYLSQQLHCQQSPAHKFFRSCMLFSNDHQAPPVIESLCIQDALGNYSAEAVRILSPYYLYL